MTMPQRITGTSLPDSGFHVHETSGTIDVARVFEVLTGKLAAYHIRDFLPAEACRRLVENFWTSPNRVARVSGYGDDGVEAYFIGASHIGKTTQQYLAEASASADAVRTLYSGTINPAAVFRSALSSGGDRTINVRAARSNGRSAGDSKAVFWNGSGHFLLEPHDDLAQTKDPDQRDFEIQQATRVMALNIYADVPRNSGQLQVWNVEPDDRSRAGLGLTYSGFPYPPELLAEYPSRIIPVGTGDLCVLNGNLAHAVLRGEPTAEKRRLLITCFMTLTATDEVIWWT
jgi:hypothetical protein